MVKSKRISFIAGLTKGYHTVLDIGTDHGLVLQEAFMNGWIKQAIAADLREQPLMQAKKNLKNYPVTFVQSDGFLAIKDSYDLAIIAGMGAYLISEIMKHAKNDQATYILQANDKHDYLRNQLMHQGYKITNEYIIHDHFYYIIIECKKGHMTLSNEDLILGPILKTKPEAIPYYERKRKQIESLLSKVDQKRQDELNRVYKIYKDFLNVIQ